MTLMPGPDKTYPLKISVQLIADLEEAQGSLYQVAERLLNQSLSLSHMIVLLKACYRHAGCVAPEAALDDFLLRRPCTELLTTILLDILEPLDRLGSLARGEPVPGGGPAGTSRRISLKHIRMFFMGVLGWTPATVMHDATLADLADAYEGHAWFQGLSQSVPARPPATFLTDMIQKFPDRKGI